MADEEVDWGMDESVDVDEWRGAAGGAGPGGARGGVGEGDGDDDVLSLGGGDEGLEEGENRSSPCHRALYRALNLLCC